MKSIKKIIAVLTVVVIAGTAFSVVNGINLYAESQNVIFEDDFNSYANNTSGAANKNAMIAKGWNTPNDTAGNYNTGSNYKVPAGSAVNISTSNVTDSDKWDNYSVSCDMCVNDTATGHSYAFISGRVNSNNGYWLRIWAKDGILRSFEIQKFANNTKTDVLGKYEFKSAERLATGTVFNVTFEMNGGSLGAYLNGKSILTVTDESYKNGCAGIYCGATNVSPVTYDNFRVTKSATGISFTDDFESSANMNTAGWSSNSSGTKDGGKYELLASKSLYLTGDTAALEWTDYTFEADVLIKLGELTSSASARIVAHSVNAVNGGYEFGITVNPDGNNAVVLYKRGVSGGKINSNTLSVAKTDIVQNKTYHLRMTLVGARIICYLDKELVFDVTDGTSPYLKGYIGLRIAGNGANAFYDNINVRNVTKSDLEQLYPDEYYYKDEFDKSASPSDLGWSNNSAVIDEKKGVLNVPANSSTYLTEINGSAEWTDYVIEAKFAIPSENCTSLTGARIVGRSTNKASNGYEYGLTYSPDESKVYLQLYKRGISGGKIGDTAYTMDLSSGQFDSHTYKMVLSGNKIICSFDSMVVFEVTDNSEPFTKGYAGLRSTGTATGFSVDSYSVREVREEDTETSGGDYEDDCYYQDGFDTDASMTVLGWSSGAASRKPSDGVCELPENVGIYLTGLKDSDKWDDYSVIASMALKESTPTAISSIRLVARSTQKSADGYEFGISYNPTTDETNLLLYKRGISGGKINGSALTRKISASAFDFHDYQITVNKGRIVCLFDGTVVFDITDTEPYQTGYAGIRNVGTKDASAVAVIDSYTVRKTVFEDFDIYRDFFPDGYYYKDDFSTFVPMTAIGWNGETGERDTAQGVYGLPSNYGLYLTGLENAEKMTDYVIESKMAVEQSDTSATISARIVARSADKANSGYEFGASVSAENNSSNLLLYKRGESAGKINNKVYTLNMGIKSGEYHDYKLVVVENRILCYFDGMKVFDVVDTGTAVKNVKLEPFMVGYAGIRAVGAAGNINKIYADNYIVRPVESADIVDDAVVSKISENLWFSDDFNGETSLSERGWSSDEANIVNGRLNVNGSLYISNVKDSNMWTDYQVSADVTVDKSGGLIGNATTGSARICLRSAGTTTGYEYGIITPANAAPYLLLYDRAKTSNIAVDKTFEIDNGTHTLSALCCGNEIQCYFDGQLVFNESSTSAVSGFAGVRSSGYETYYDNFKVTKLGAYYDFGKDGKSPSTGAHKAVCGVVIPAAMGFSALVAIAALLLINSKKRILQNKV